MEEKVLYQIKSLEKTIMRNFLDDPDNNFNMRCNHVTTATQHQILSYILKHKDEVILQRDLESVLNLRRATVSGVLQTMEKNKLIKRISYKNDSRVKQIILNNEAREIFKKGEEKIKKIEAIAIDGIDEESLVTFLEVINKMKENIINSNIKKG